MKFLKDLPPKLKAMADYEILDSPVYRWGQKHKNELLASAFIWAKTKLGYALLEER